MQPTKRTPKLFLVNIPRTPPPPETNVISEYQYTHKEPHKHKEYHRIFTAKGRRFFAKRMETAFDWELFECNGMGIEKKVALSSAKAQATDAEIFKGAIFL